LIDQQRRVAQPTRGLTISLEQKLMIAGNNDLRAMGEFAEPGIEVGIHCRTPAEECEISGMNEDVAVRDIEFAMQLVGIGDANDAN
jgi:hypothetical protein